MRRKKVTAALRRLLVTPALSRLDRRNEAHLKSDHLLDGWQPVTKYWPGASPVIGIFIDFQACRYA